MVFFSKPNVDGLFVVSNLEKCLNFGKDVVTGKGVISSRGNVELVDENKICAYHWFNPGSFWRAPQCCLHTLHENKETDWRKCRKVKDLKQSNIAAYKRIKGQFPDSNFPIFAYLCTKYRKVKKEEQNLDNYNDIDDPNYECNTSLESTAVNEMKSFIETSTLGVVSPVKFRINKPIRELSSSTTRYQKRKYKSFNENCKQSYPKLVAPGQENKFASIVSCESEENDTVLENLKFLYQAYQIADTEKQRALILSAIPNKTYTIKQIMTNRQESGEIPLVV